MAKYTIDKIEYGGNIYNLEGKNLKNLVDGSMTGSIRSVGTAEEGDNYTIGTYAFTEGLGTVARGDNGSHAEGYVTNASGESAHAEGGDTSASGEYSHAEGYDTTAEGSTSHAEGILTVAAGAASHAEGGSTIASGSYSHAQGNATIAIRKSQTALGEFNILEDGDSTTKGTYAVIVGNGTADNARSNALTIDWSGNTSQQGRATTKDMTSSEVTSFINSLDLTGSKAADYVVEQGTSGIWTYRKWQSGIAECWGRTDVSSHTYPAGGTNLVRETLPINLFISRPVINTSGGIEGMVNSDTLYSNIYEDNNTFETYIINVANTSVTNIGWIYWQIRGRWK